jgi:hypothetical protein
MWRSKKADCSELKATSGAAGSSPCEGQHVNEMSRAIRLVAWLRRHGREVVVCSANDLLDLMIEPPDTCFAKFPTVATIVVVY